MLTHVRHGNVHAVKHNGSTTSQQQFDAVEYYNGTVVSINLIQTIVHV